MNAVTLVFKKTAAGSLWVYTPATPATRELLAAFGVDCVTHHTLDALRIMYKVEVVRDGA